MSNSDEHREYPTEHVFAKNLKKLRTAAGTSQEAFAESMAAWGYRWHQATVYKVENGSRQIQLGEARAAARILGVPLDRMADSLDLIESIEPLRRLLKDVGDTGERLANAAAEYDAMRDVLWHMYDELDGDDKDLLKDVERSAIERFAIRSAADVVTGNGSEK